MRGNFWSDCDLWCGERATASEAERRETGSAVAAKAASANGAQTAESSLVTLIRDTGFVQLKAESFNDLTADQKMAAYWFSMAAIAVNPIGYDQNSAYGLREKHLLEAILTHSKGIDPVVLKKITDYTMLGAAREITIRSPEKIPARFHLTAELSAAANQALKNGAQLESPVALAKELQTLGKAVLRSDL